MALEYLDENTTKIAILGGFFDQKILMLIFMFLSLEKRYKEEYTEHSELATDAVFAYGDFQGQYNVIRSLDVPYRYCLLISNALAYARVCCLGLCE